MLRPTKLNIYFSLVVLFFLGNIKLLAQLQVEKIAFKETSSLNNTVGFSGACVNVFFRDAANRHKEFTRKFKSSNFEGELNYWYVDSTSNEFSYELFDCDLGSHPILIVTDFNWNINRINMVFRDKNYNVELKILKSSQNGRHFYILVKASGMCSFKEEFDFYMPAIELTIKDLTEVYNSTERLGDQKYVSKIEYYKLQNSTDSLLRKLNRDFNDSLNVYKKSLHSVSVKNEGLRFIMGLQGFASPKSNNYFVGNVNVLLGLDYKLKKIQFNISAGPQQLQESWGSSNIPYAVSKLNSTSQYFDELLITGKNISEEYTLKVNSVLVGLQVKFSCGNSRFFVGFTSNYSKPFSNILSYKNTSGLFDYVGFTSAVEESLLNMPDLGLLSNVSYVSYKSNISGSLKSFWQLGALMGYSFGEKSLLDLNFSIGYITSKKFELDITNSAISSSYGNYNSILTVNNSQITIPRYLNFGIGIIKYLN
jgi:hypothetical protein